MRRSALRVRFLTAYGSMMKRLLGHIALWVCCLFGALSLSGAEVPQRLPHDSGSPRTAAELVCSLDTQGAAMRQFIHDSLRSDNLPAAQGVNGSRVLTPVFRLDPRLDFLTGAMPAMLRNTPCCNIVCRNSSAPSFVHRSMRRGITSLPCAKSSFSPHLNRFPAPACSCRPCRRSL